MKQDGIKTDQSATTTPTIAGWEEFVDSLRGLPAQVLAMLPNMLQNDRQIQQEVGRRILASITLCGLEFLGSDGDYPVFMPGTGQVLNVAQPNADSLYRMARIKPCGTYRLRGQLGPLRIAAIGQSGPLPGEPGGENLERPGDMYVYHDLHELRLDAQGRFDVLISPKRPEGYEGDWWALDPRTYMLFLRMVKGDWDKERDAIITIDRLDVPAARPRRTADELEDRLRRLPKTISYFSRLLIEHVEQLRSRGFVNKLTEFDVSGLMGLHGQFYFEGAYEVADDEALIVETRIPPGCKYWSVIMTNEIFETVDWYNNHSCLNDTQAKPDKDGVLRIVISAKDPGVPNWLDTAGYPTGEFQGRWYGTNEPCLPTMRKVAFGDLSKSLPPETPLVTADERDRLVRHRRMVLQERPLW